MLFFATLDAGEIFNMVRYKDIDVSYDYMTCD